MSELILAAAAYPAAGLIGGLLGTGVGIVTAIIVVEGASDEPAPKRMIPLWMWLVFWTPLGLILMLTDMPGWMRTALFLIPMAITLGLFNRRAG